MTTDKGGRSTYRSPDNKTTARVQNGRVTEVRTSDAVIRRPPGGTRTVVAQRPNGETVVARGGAGGYVQRPVVVGGRTHVQRTYVQNTVISVGVFRPVVFHGVSLDVYAPLGFYPVGFYGWTLAPWGLPIDYDWGYLGDPWFVYYGPYFRPWGVYARPSLWLTDYLIASTLKAAFEARAEAQAAASAAVDPGEPPAAVQAPLSDDIKALVDAEVREQLAEIQAQAGGLAPANDALPPSFTDRSTHLLVADDSLEVNTRTGGSCVLQQGDIIQMSGGLPRIGTDVNVTVLAGRGGCPANRQVSVQLTDLVAMHNSMMENLDHGLEAMRASQGTGNLPMLPVEAAGDRTPTSYAAAIEPDGAAAQMIADLSARADLVEASVVADYRTVSDPGFNPALATVDPRQAGLLASLQHGLTESQVVAILGPPLNASFLGGVRKQYEYAAGKVIFTDGEVTDVQASAQTLSAPITPPGRASSARPIADGTPGPAPAGAGGPAISNGLTEGQVIQIMGQPLRISFLGGLRKVYEYGDRKIIFTDGKVSEVQ